MPTSSEKSEPLWPVSAAHQRKSGRSGTSSGEAIEASCRSFSVLTSTVTHS